MLRTRTASGSAGAGQGITSKITALRSPKSPRHFQGGLQFPPWQNGLPAKTEPGGKSETSGTPQDLESEATNYPHPEEPLRGTVRTLYPHERNEKSEHAVGIIVVYMFYGNEDDLSLFTCNRYSLWQEETALIRRRTGLKDIQNKSKRQGREAL